MKQDLTRIDRFAEHLANGLTVSEVADRMRLTRGAASGLLRRIRAGLGWQAQ